jgi:hypothetical protein
MRDEPVEFWSIAKMWERGVERFMGFDMGTGYFRTDYDAKEWRCEEIGKEAFRSLDEAMAAAEVKRIDKIALLELLLLKAKCLKFNPRTAL